MQIRNHILISFLQEINFPFPYNYFKEPLLSSIPNYSKYIEFVNSDRGQNLAYHKIKMPNKKEIEIIVRALIIKKNRVLVCKNKEERHYFLPGGHLKFGESAASALSRELKEELGAKSEIGSLIGVCEHFYREKGKKHHEINLIFEVKIEKIDLKGKERKLKFYLKDLKEFKKIYFLPKDLKMALIGYFKNKKFFWQNF